MVQVPDRSRFDIKLIPIGESIFSPPEASDCLVQGYEREEVTKLLPVIALKIISSYLDHISLTPVDRSFAAESKQSPL
jgi:hypothetical protein